MARRKQIGGDWAFPNINAKSVVEITKKSGGATVDPSTGKLEESGTFVSVSGHEGRVPVSEFTGDTIKDYASRENIQEALTKYPTRRLGTWVDTDEAGNPTAFLDVSRKIKATPEGNQRARIAMMAANQFAAFNLDTFKTEYNPLEKTVLHRAGGAPELQEGERERWLRSKQPMGSEVVYAWTTEPQKVSRGRGRKKQTISPGQGMFIFTGSEGQMAPPQTLE